MIVVCQRRLNIEPRTYGINQSKFYAAPPVGQFPVGGNTGPKNWLHAGSDAGGERAAAMYSLIGSAKLNGMDPQAYFHHVLERIAEHPVNQVSELLPWNLAAQIERDTAELRLAA